MAKTPNVPTDAPPPARPRGHDEILDAVIAAATELFADRGPAAVPLRDVAVAANVTLSQIHRHVGNKEALIGAVLLADVMRAGTPQLTADRIELAAWLKLLFQPPGPPDVRTRLHGRVILDGYDLPDLQARFPGMELTIELLSRRIPVEEARVRTGLLTAFFAGWRLFGDVYLRAAEADHVDADRFREIIGPMLDAIAAAPAAAPPAP